MRADAIKPTISVSYLPLVRGGDATNLDIGGYANSAWLLASDDLGHFHVDANGFVNETEGPIRRARCGQAVAVTHPGTPKLSATAEQASRHTPRAWLSTAVFTCCLAWTIGRSSGPVTTRVALAVVVALSSLVARPAYPAR